ncbi:MAG: NAD(P)H-quinone oxidoreductase [Hyphomonadaceae bacterium]
MNATMRAIHHEPGKPLTMETLAIPTPGADEVLIKIAAAGLNRADLLQREGKYPPPPGAPETMGMEASGVIEAVGAHVQRWKPGDKVCALLGGGGYADYVAAHAGSVLPAPAGVSLRDAAGLPEAVMTVWVNVFEAAALMPGETVLFHGGASGIGTTGIQMVKAHGARVFATAGDGAKTALCEKLGAARGINYKSEDFEAVLKDAGGADVVLDMIGGPYLMKNINLLKTDGRVSMIAALQGAKTEIDLLRVMMKRAVLTGSTLRNRPLPEKARVAAAVEKIVWPWIEAGGVRPVIDATFPLAEAEAAHARLRSGAHAGKILLTM